ncbi:MAG: quinohemoprotein ethanol dehydrogenase [Gaiellales bacterium]|jgi:mono/diheme cytochrome c family protein|nr:quinohemoprotein ethanol dehydrogenase [Gaiellales bacterium]
MRPRPSLLVLPVLAVALLASGCFQARTAGTVSTPITVAVGTTQTEVNPAASTSTPATTTGSTSGSTTATATTSASTGTTTTSTGGGTPSYPPTAKAKFASTCGGCHTLADAGTHGNVGPNLDDLKPDEARVAKQIANGGKVMPAGLLKGQDLKDVAAYVAAVAGKSSGSSNTGAGGAP